jgi:L-cysteine S-thiosulfotransferase
VKGRAWACALLWAWVGCLQAAPPVSGFDTMSPPLQAMQRDEGANPGILWVQGGARFWEQPAGAAQRACASCHGPATRSMRGVAARYPAFDALSRGPVDLGQRINLCRQRHQQAAPLARESEELLGLEAFVATQSRGLPLAPPADARLQPAREWGERLFHQRLGQLDLSCAQCHDQHAGGRLGGSLIPQGHPNGYPLYRLEWQQVGGLQRRLRNCQAGVRAEPFAWDSPELIALSTYLASRAAGLNMESPAVRP